MSVSSPQVLEIMTPFNRSFSRISLILQVMLIFFAYLPASKALEIGDEVCVEGFIMDGFCLYDTGGFLLDRSSVRTLGNPGRHTFHCLLDVGVCLNSDFHVLGEPEGGSGDYTVAFRVDQMGKEMLVAEGRKLGKPGSYPACSECTGSANGPLEGFRAEVRGMVTNLGDGTDSNPPTLAVSAVAASDGQRVDDGMCSTLPPTGQPTKFPTVSPTISPTATQVTFPPTDIPTSFPTKSATAMPTVGLARTSMPTLASSVATANPTEQASSSLTEPPTQSSSSRIPLTQSPTSMPYMQRPEVTNLPSSPPATTLESLVGDTITTPENPAGASLESLVDNEKSLDSSFAQRSHNGLLGRILATTMAAVLLTIESF